MRGRVLLLAGLLAGCGRTVTEDDCVKIRENMREAWTAESKKAAEGTPAPERTTVLVKVEGEKLVTDWMGECKKELMGRRVDPREMDCLLKSKTIAEINKCAEQ